MVELRSRIGLELVEPDSRRIESVEDQVLTVEQIERYCRSR